MQGLQKSYSCQQQVAKYIYRKSRDNVHPELCWVLFKFLIEICELLCSVYIFINAYYKVNLNNKNRINIHTHMHIEYRQSDNMLIDTKKEENLNMQAPNSHI